MMIGGVIAAIVLTLVGMTLDWDDSLQTATIVWAALVLLAWVVALVGCFTMRFELVGSANK
jgi:multisubunit Na+/H+ antiporter MnhB subunit